jgi:hypothetical protein
VGRLVPRKSGGPLDLLQVFLNSQSYHSTVLPLGVSLSSTTKRRSRATTPFPCLPSLSQIQQSFRVGVTTFATAGLLLRLIAGGPGNSFRRCSCSFTLARRCHWWPRLVRLGAVRGCFVVELEVACVSSLESSRLEIEYGTPSKRRRRRVSVATCQVARTTNIKSAWYQS